MNNHVGRRSRIGNERGSVLALVVVGLVVIVGMAALAVDLGILFSARSEAQRAAEAGAHAGAAVFLHAPNDVVAAREQARTFAERNFVRNLGVEVRDEDIDVVPAEQLVRVRVNRIEDRGNPVGTIFARIFGITDVNVGAVAAAQSWPAGGTNCMLPFALPDRWSEGPSPAMVPPTSSDRFGDDPNDFYTPWDESNPDAPYTGYSPDDRGQEIRIYAADPNQAPVPSWWYAMAVPGGTGANWMRDWIQGCPDPSFVAQIGQSIDVEPGAMVGPVRQGFQNLIAQDSNAIWNSSANGGRGCVTDRGSSVCRGSPRIKPILMFDPNDYPPSGRRSVPVTNFAGLFIDRVEGGGSNLQVVARFVEYVELFPADEWSASGPLARVLRIVE